MREDKIKRERRGDEEKMNKRKYVKWISHCLFSLTSKILNANLTTNIFESIRLSRQNVS